MTEHEVIQTAAEAFKRRDKVAEQFKAIDAEIDGLVREYSLAMRLWGFTPTMLRRAVVARLGKEAA